MTKGEVSNRDEPWVSNLGDMFYIAVQSEIE